MEVDTHLRYFSQVKPPFKVTIFSFEMSITADLKQFFLLLMFEYCVLTALAMQCTLK